MEEKLFNKMINDLHELRKQKITYLDGTEQHFEEGDLAWVIYEWSPIIKPKQVKITYVDKYFHEKYEGKGYIFYWFEDIDIKWFDRLKLKLGYHFWNLTSFLKDRPYLPPSKFGPGHGVRAGRGNELFKTREECEEDYLFSEAINILQDLRDVYEDKNS